jgi:hypothetical protein
MVKPGLKYTQLFKKKIQQQQRLGVLQLMLQNIVFCVPVVCYGTLVRVAIGYT